MSNTNPFAGLEPQGLWRHFEAITRIPRPSGQEEKMAEYIRSWAKARGYQVKQDAVNNLCVHVPARPGYESAAPIVLQSHIDMVCERNSGCPYDTTNGSMHVQREGDWLSAEGTTLGADNGIGCSAMLYLAELDNIGRAPLDLLFTIDEERGLTGAKNLDPAMIRGRTLLNLDSEDDTMLVVGCSGGKGSTMLWTDPRQPEPADALKLQISVSGLRGGHSGLEIDKNRLNAVQALARILRNVETGIPLRVVSLEGGDKSNAIPRECRGVVSIAASAEPALREAVKAAAAVLAEQYRGLETEFKVEVTAPAAAGGPAPFSQQGTRRLLDLLCGIPTSVIALSQDIAGLVETSNNLGSVRTNGDEVKIVCSSRSSIAEALQGVLVTLRSLARLAHAGIEEGEGYCGWKPNMSSRALAVTQQTYRRLFGSDPVVTAIHAGLECGLIGDRIPGMDMVSLGPEIRGVHAPGERVKVSSVKRFADLLIAVVGDLSQPAGR